MIIKKFQGKTEAEATENAKKELGNGVVVMNVKNLKKKGLFSFFKPQVVEVTVALEDDTERFTAPKKEPVHTGIAPVINRPVNVAPVSAESKEDEKKVEVLEEKIDSIQNMLAASLQKKEEPEEEKQGEAKKKRPQLRMKTLFVS